MPVPFVLLSGQQNRNTDRVFREESLKNAPIIKQVPEHGKSHPRHQGADSGAQDKDRAGGKQI